MEHALQKPCSASKAIYTSYTGISPLAANEFAIGQIWTVMLHALH